MLVMNISQIEKKNPVRVPNSFLKYYLYLIDNLLFITFNINKNRYPVRVEKVEKEVKRN
jgi:hypothetical protein